MKVLVLGASGFVGRRVMNLFGPGRAQGAYRAPPPEGGLRFDAQIDDFDALLRQAAADLTHVMLLHHTSDRVVNVQGMQRIARTCLRKGLIPIYASTDYVFSGERGGWREEDPTRPLTDYGRQKAEMEMWFAAQPGAWLIARLSKVVSSEIEPRNILSEWVTDIRSGRTIRCARDQVLAPVDARDVASALLDLIEQGADGLFNIAGPALTRLELLEIFLRKWRKRFGGPTPDVTPCLLSEVFDDPRPLDTSLDVRKLKAAVDFRPRSMDAVCEELVTRAASSL